MKDLKIKVKTANAQKQLHTFEFAHGTTSKFFEPSVPFIKEVVKDTDTKIMCGVTRRLDPMPLPTMSNVKFNTRFYFVPMPDICPYYDNLDTGLPYQFRFDTGSSDYVSAIPTKVPTLNNATLLELFFHNYVSVYDSSIPSLTAQTSEQNPYVIPANTHLLAQSDDDYINTYRCDFYVYCEAGSFNGNPNYRILGFNLTRRGRNAYKLLKQLGYDISLNREFHIKSKGGLDIEESHEIEFSALPLLAWLKVILSYYENSAFINNTVRLAEMNALLHIDVDAYSLTIDDIDNIIDFSMYMTYERDYFTTQFVNPIGGNEFENNNEQILIYDNTTSNPQDIRTEQSGTPLLNISNTVTISSMGIKLLQRLTNFIRRNQIAGGRVVDRTLLQFGVSMSDGYSRRTSYIDTIKQVMQVNAVFNTTSEQLADYAGVGTAKSEFDHNNPIIIKSGENRGFIIAIDTAVPELFYTQGYNRNNRHITKFDFLCPQFDAVSIQAVEQGELICNKDGRYDYLNQSSPSQLRCGDKPRYSEYKEMYNILTGDFITKSINTDLDGYFTYRKLDPKNYLNNGQISVTQSRAFSATYDNDQYARIFYFNEVKSDYIKSLFRFAIEMYAPMVQEYDEFRLEDDNGSQEVTTTPGGQTMN